MSSDPVCPCLGQGHPFRVPAAAGVSIAGAMSILPSPPRAVWAARAALGVSFLLPGETGLLMTISAQCGLGQQGKRSVCPITSFLCCFKYCTGGPYSCLTCLAGKEQLQEERPHSSQEIKRFSQKMVLPLPNPGFCLLLAVL